jgi:hypothetical protein
MLGTSAARSTSPGLLFLSFPRVSDIRYREAPMLTHPYRGGGGAGAEERLGAGDPYLAACRTFRLP